MLIGEVEKKTKVRFKKNDDLETHNSAIGVVYDSEDVIFTGWLYELNTLEPNKVNRSQYCRGTNFKQDIVEYTGNNCYIPTSGNCFIKCGNHPTGRDYMIGFSTFIPTGGKRSNVMTSARFQPFCEKHNINIGRFDGTTIIPRNITQTNISLFIFNFHFCFI